MASLPSLLCILVFAGTAIVTAESGAVLNGWFPLGTGYQYHVYWGLTNWHAARNYCRSFGGDLAVRGMKNYGIRLAISNIMLNGGVFWIGAHDLYSEGRWQWVDGSSGSSSNLHWDKGEPNNVGEEDCAAIEARRGYQTIDFPCHAKINALCEKTI